MSNAPEPAAQLTGDQPAASSPGALLDRRELAFIAVERTRMPMLVTDPRQHDNPIVLANQAFLNMSGYSAEEIVGSNCRFLQGPETDRNAVAEIRAAIADEREVTVDLLNYRKDGSAFWNQLFLSPVHSNDGQLLYFFASQKDVTDRIAAQQLAIAELRLLREVDHRAKNALALVQGIVRLSRSDDAEIFSRAVQGRVDALARAHSLLAEQRWRGAPLDRLIHAEVEPFGVRRVSAAGPATEVAASHVQPLALLLHEMLANAAQHGSLSSPEGKVSIQWTDSPDEDAINIAWVETNGPPPAASRPPGFGMTMVEAIIRRQLNGRMNSEWQSGGLRSEIVLPRATTSNG